MKKLLRDAGLRRVLWPWGALLSLIVLDLLLLLLGAGAIAPLIGLVMSGIVVAIPMELPSAPNAARIFALAGAFWLVFMLFGLGTLDPLTRHDQPTSFHSEP
jgi:hypothetical protein